MLNLKNIDSNPKENEGLKACPIKLVYEKFKHLDQLFSDKIWLDTDDYSDGYALRCALYDMWEAIKEYNTRTKETEEGH